MSELHLSPTLRRILLEALILSSLAFAVGLSANYSLVMNAFTGKTVVSSGNKPPAVAATAPASVVEQAFPDPVDLDEIDDLLAEGALLIDARNIDDYKAGHLKNAISLPLGDVDRELNSFLQQVGKDQVLILYCNGFGCPDSFDLGQRLIEVGYQQVRVYEGGFPEWRDAGRPLEEGQK